MPVSDRCKDPYERKFLELILRHELPDDVKVSINVSEPMTRSSDLGSVEFALGKQGIDVRGSLAQSGLKRTVNPVPPWCW
ncbi:MAG TPA: hypothetical protein VEA61_09440 [Allosphingosinicella sp.]|nr:hypothetical protein [Allosphingosinicella sp.]